MKIKFLRTAALTAFLATSLAVVNANTTQNLATTTQQSSSSSCSSSSNSGATCPLVPTATSTATVSQVSSPVASALEELSNSDFDLQVETSASPLMATLFEEAGDLVVVPAEEPVTEALNSTPEEETVANNDKDDEAKELENNPLPEVPTEDETAVTPNDTAKPATLPLNSETEKSEDKDNNSVPGTDITDGNDKDKGADEKAADLSNPTATSEDTNEKEVAKPNAGSLPSDEVQDDEHRPTLEEPEDPEKQDKSKLPDENSEIDEEESQDSDPSAVKPPPAEEANGDNGSLGTQEHPAPQDTPKEAGADPESDTDVSPLEKTGDGDSDKSGQTDSLPEKGDDDNPEKPATLAEPEETLGVEKSHSPEPAHATEPPGENGVNGSGTQEGEKERTDEDAGATPGNPDTQAAGGLEDTSSSHEDGEGTRTDSPAVPTGGGDGAGGAGAEAVEERRETGGETSQPSGVQPSPEALPPSNESTVETQS